MKNFKLVFFSEIEKQNLLKGCTYLDSCAANLDNDSCPNVDSCGFDNEGCTTWDYCGNSDYSDCAKTDICLNIDNDDSCTSFDWCHKDNE